MKDWLVYLVAVGAGGHATILLGQLPLGPQPLVATRYAAHLP
jgi:hypothetical protein